MSIKNQTYQSISDYYDIISAKPENASCIEYLFNILKQIGLFRMSQGEIDEEVLNRVKKLFSYNTLQTSNIHAPSFTNFEELNQEADQFISISIKPHPRVPMHNTEAILWEEEWESVIELGTRLIENGLMMKAVSQGEDLLCLSDCKAGEKVSNAWSQSWQKFEEKSLSFINKLITKENIEKFFILSDDVVSLLAEYAFIPEDNFQKFLYNIAAPKENYAKNHNYRKLITAGEAKELFEQVKEKYQNNLNVSLAYTFEAAMAQKAVKNFILNNCSLLRNAGSSNYGKLLTNLDINTGSETPFIIAGNKLFTNHIIISDGFLSGLGVRKDDDAIESLNQSDTDFSGALFCSLKQYPNGAWTISFDSYKNKEQFYKLIEQGDEYFVRLPYEQIFDEDKREEFLQEAAEAVMGLKKQPESNLIKFPKQTTISQKDDVFMGTQSADDYKHAYAAGGDDSDEVDAEFKEMVKVTIKRIDQWKGLFSSFKKRTEKDFQKLVHPENGEFCYAAIIVYKNHKIELINVADLPESPERTDIGKELSKDENCLSIYLGITNKSKKDAFSKIIDEYKDALENNTDIQSEKLQIIRWIKFNFKFNQTE